MVRAGLLEVELGIQKLAAVQWPGFEQTLRLLGFWKGQLRFLVCLLVCHLGLSTGVQPGVYCECGVPSITRRRR